MRESRMFQCFNHELEMIIVELLVLRSFAVHSKVFQQQENFPSLMCVTELVISVKNQTVWGI